MNSSRENDLAWSDEPADPYSAALFNATVTVDSARTNQKKTGRALAPSGARGGPSEGGGRVSANVSGITALRLTYRSCDEVGGVEPVNP